MSQEPDIRVTENKMGTQPVGYCWPVWPSP